TSAAFGFSRGFQTFKSFSPNQEATHVVEETVTWIAAHKTERFVIVVHARGGHPPWDVPADQMKALPPDQYSGPIEPGAHAAEILDRRGDDGARGARPRAAAVVRRRGSRGRRRRRRIACAVREHGKPPARQLDVAPRAPERRAGRGVRPGARRDVLERRRAAH